MFCVAQTTHVATVRRRRRCWRSRPSRCSDARARPGCASLCTPPPLHHCDLMILRGQEGHPRFADLVPPSDAFGDGVSEWSVGRPGGQRLLPWVGRRPAASLVRVRSRCRRRARRADLPRGAVGRAHRPGPESPELTEAATLPGAALTAWSALYGNRPLPPDHLRPGRRRAGARFRRGVAVRYPTRPRGRGHGVGDAEQPGESRAARRARGERGRRLRATPMVGIGGLRPYRWGGARRRLRGSGSLDQAIAAVAPGGEIARFGMVDLR